MGVRLAKLAISFYGLILKFQGIDSESERETWAS